MNKKINNDHVEQNYIASIEHLPKGWNFLMCRNFLLYVITYPLLYIIIR